MTDEMIEKAKREFEQLKKMDSADAAAIVGGYHRQLINGLSDALRNVKKLVDLSPNMIGLSDTAVLVAERDCFDKKDDIELLGIVGSDNQVANIIDEIFKNSPGVFEEICKRHGLVAEKTA